SLSPSGGIEETRRLRALPGMATAPILLFGGDELRVYGEPGIQVLPKPIRRAQVYQAVNLALRIPTDPLDDALNTMEGESGFPGAPLI
ncbi:MAG: hypothetical protein HQL95_15060, partial [Magnetococcales bacterium]|nr:hypothetical protein [Magnetococcales bacterium]